MIRFAFNNWKLKLLESEAQQYDHKTIDVLVTGEIPSGWSWNLYIAKDCFLDIIPLSEDEEGLHCTLLRSHLAFSGTYRAQLYASYNDTTLPDKRSSEERFTVNQSCGGDLKWPDIPTAFTDSVTQAEEAANAASEAAEHYPYIDPESRHWFVWNVLYGEYEDTGVNAGGSLSYEVVDELPEASEDTLNIIYFVPSPDPQQYNIRDEYVTIDRDGGYYWEQIGSTAVDISSKEDAANKVTVITPASTNIQYPSAKAVYDFVEDTDHFIVSDFSPYTDPTARNKLWIDPTDNTENPGGSGSDLPMKITKSVEPGPGGDTVYDIEFT